MSISRKCLEITFLLYIELEPNIIQLTGFSRRDLCLFSELEYVVQRRVIFGGAWEQWFSLDEFLSLRGATGMEAEDVAPTRIEEVCIYF